MSKAILSLLGLLSISKFSAFALPQAKVKSLNDGEKEFMLMTHNLDPGQNFKVIILSKNNKRKTNEQIQLKKKDLNVAKFPGAEGTRRSSKVSTVHCVKLSMIYELKPQLQTAPQHQTSS